MTTVAHVLFDRADPAAALAAVPPWRGVVDGVGRGLGAVSSATRGVVEQELARVSAGLLSVDLGDVLLGAWGRHRAFVAAARATQADPGAREVVQLATHRITTTHRPYVTVAIAGAQVATVRFELTLAIDIDSLVATVARARLVALQSGRCVATASLGVEGHPIIERQAALDPMITVPLGEGIRLIAESAGMPLSGA